MDNVFLNLLVLVGASIAITAMLTRLKIHPVIGFIVSGAVIGPNGFKLISNPSSIEAISEIGVILLLFTLGLEFSINKLIRLKRYVLFGGGLQLFATLAVFFILGIMSFERANEAIILGILTSLSSTAIVLKLLSDQGLVDSPMGKMGMGILLFQDIMVVPIMITVPLLASETIVFTDILLKILKSFGLGIIVFFVSKYLTNFLLSRIVKLRVRELFILTIILISLGTAFLTGTLGISMSLGAFLAGVVLADSVYTHQIIADIQPFKDCFLAVFFVSIGLLTDFSYIYQNTGKVVLFAASLVVLKGGIIAIISYYLTRSGRVSFRLGLSLFQIGEFSFVVAALSNKLGIIDYEFYQLFLAGSVFSMVLTPFGFKYGNKVYDFLLGERLHVLKETPQNNELSNHVIIIGFGLNGRNLSHVLKETHIKYVICEMNINTVKEMEQKGEPIIFGDATKEEILHQLGIKTARVVVVAISDPDATKRIVKACKSVREDIHLIVRTRYVAEVELYKNLGADEIIPEEFETSIEIFSRVLNRYNVPVNMIQRMIEEIRRNNYESLRITDLPPKKIFSRSLEDLVIDVVPYEIIGESELVGQSIKFVDLRAKTGASIIAIKRGENIIQSPTSEEVFKAGDIVYLTGTKEVIAKATEYLNRFEIEIIT